MRKTIYIYLFILFCALSIQSGGAKSVNSKFFVSISGQNLLRPDGTKLNIKGTNLGNWLNPEGYMFDFKKANSEHLINEMLCEMVGPDFTSEFWKQFKDNYITQQDIDFIASTGANTIRLPFHYKLFTNEDYMGLSENQDGFARIDSIVKWCRKDNIFVILDMHDAPGGQTGDNIDDSYGYPWLFESETSQTLFCKIWKKIASRYKNEPVILGYELINESIAPYQDWEKRLNDKLEPLHKRAVKAIREVDKNHIILLGAPQWNTNFKAFKDSKYDNKIMYTCHRYGGEPTKEAIKDYIDFRDSVNLPMYMGETGHNTNAWQTKFRKVLEENNIGWTFWPYKKIENSCFMAIKAPCTWDSVKTYCEAKREIYPDIRASRPSQVITRKALFDFIENCKYKNCAPQKDYIKSLGLHVDE